MSWKQTTADKSTVFGSGSISRVVLPYIISGIRRNDPDMVSVNAYYPGLSGKTVVLEQGGDYSATTTITFTSDAYYIALSTINTLTHLKAADYDGFLGFVSQHAGGNNYLKVTGGTALSILGIDIYPHPAAISYAGEIDSPKPSTYESRTKGTGVILKNEGVNRENWNRGLAAIGYVLDSMQSNLDREVAFPVQYSTTINGASFSVISTDRFFIAGNGISTPNPSADVLDKLITVVDTNNNLLFDANGDRVRVTSVTYGTLTSTATSFSAWNVADGKSVFGNTAHYQKQKSVGTIAAINGNTIKCTGATFITDLVQTNDTVRIDNATNLSPFSHNGEFVVDEVLTNEILRVRPKGTSTVPLTGVGTPTCLNQVRQLGENYGQATVYVGSFLPLILPAGNMTFNLSATLPNTTYKVVLPIGRSLKTLLQEDLTASLISHPNGGQIEVGSKLISTLANALKPRIISHPNGDTSKTLLAEFKNGAIGTRIYTLLAGGVELVYNGVWNGTIYVQEDVTKDTVIMKEDLASIFLGTSNVALTIDWVNKAISLGTATNQFAVTNSTGILKAKMVNSFVVNDGTLDVLTVPKFDGTSASQLILKAGQKMGTGFTTDNQHLIEKINFTCNTTSTKYTLLSETTLSAGRKRDYVLADGTFLTTVNAKWDGTQWIKDTAVNSYKLSFSNFDFQLYKELTTTSPFTDIQWTNYKIPLSLADVQGAVLNNTLPIFLEEFTGGDVTKYQFTTTLSDPSKCSFGPNTASDIGCFGAGKLILTANATTWSLQGSAGSLEANTRDFVMRYRFKIKDKALLRPSPNLTSIGANLLSISDALFLSAASDLTFFSYTVDLASTPSTVSIQNDTWYTVEWHRFLGKMYLTIFDGTTTSTIINGVTDSVARFPTPQYSIQCDNASSPTTPVDAFLIDFFEVYRK